NNPFAKQETTTAATTSTTLPQPDLSLWQDKYEEFLLDAINGKKTILGYELEIEECRFDVKFIDGDEIPELLISEGEFPGSKVSIFGYDGFEIRLLGSLGANGSIDYIELENKIFVTEETEDQKTFSVYSISDYKLGEVFNATEFVTEGNEKLLINGEETDKENYDALLVQNTPVDFETAGRNMFELKSEYVLPVIEGNTESIEAQEIETATAEESETAGESIPGESESAADDSGEEISEEYITDYTSEVLQ
ncbi:MAG: hypothetical protein IKS04_00550, partial [Clostridia bacterium]|nr:hypothetical protein [Clostridia bacterium]